MVKKILIIDDESDIVEIMTNMVEELDYESISFTQVKEALEYYRINHSDINLVITDSTMPEYTGENLSREMKKINDKVKIIMSCGFNLKNKIKDSEDLNIQLVLVKPVSIYQLSQAISEVINS